MIFVTVNVWYRTKSRSVSVLSFSSIYDSYFAVFMLEVLPCCLFYVQTVIGFLLHFWLDSMLWNEYIEEAEYS